MWYNPRTPPALPPRSPKRPDQTGLPSPPLLPPRPVSYMPYRPAGPEQWDTSPLQWTHGDQRRQSVPAGAPVSCNSGTDTSQTLRRKPIGAEVVRPALPPRPYTSSPPVRETSAPRPRPMSYVSPGPTTYHSYVPPSPSLSPPAPRERPRSVSCVSPESIFASPVSFAPPSPPNDTPSRPVSCAPWSRWSTMPSPPAEPPATVAPRAPWPRWSLVPSELDAGESSPAPAPAPEPPLERDELVDDIDELLSELEISSAGWNGSDPSIDGLDHRRPSLKITHYPDDYAELSRPVDVLPLSPPAVPPKLPLVPIMDDAPETDTTACLAAPMTYAFPATWYSHPDMPGVWVCAGCFTRHLAGTKFDPQFDGRAYDDGRPRACWFGDDRVVHELLPRALATGFLQPLIDHLNEVATPRAP